MNVGRLLITQVATCYANSSVLKSKWAMSISQIHPKILPVDMAWSFYEDVKLKCYTLFL